VINRPETWSSDNDYIVGQLKVRSLKVINDAAQRGVALIQQFDGESVTVQVASRRETPT